MHSESQPTSGSVQSSSAQASSAASDPTGGPTSQQSRVDELADRLRAANADPTIANLILDNWQRTIGTIAIVFLGFWLYNEYQAKQSEQVGELSRRFEEARRSLLTLTVERETPAEPAKSEEEKNDLETGIKGADEAFKLVGSQGGGTAYSTFAEIYRSLASAYQNNAYEALADLKKFNLEQYYGATEPSASMPVKGINVTNEVAALLAARLTAAKDQDLARKQLSGLSLSAQFVNCEALISLFRLAQTTEQKSQAESIAKKVVLARPEQLDMIQSDLAPFGFKP